MASINTIEQIILEMIQEDLTTADNWDGTSEVRDWIADGIDELSILGRFYRRRLYVPLRGDTIIYLFSPTKEVVVQVKGIWLQNKDRRLEQTDFVKLTRNDPKWLATRGSPWQYFILDFTKFGVYPCYSEDEDVVEIDAIMVAEPYTTHRDLLEVHAGYEDSLIHYCKSMLYLRIPGRLPDAVGEYQKFLEYAGAGTRFLSDLGLPRMKRKLSLAE